MPDSSNGSFKNWILGVLGAVLAALIIFVAEQYLTKPAHTFISINGRVIDETANRLISNALVTLSGQSVNEQQRTDSEGRYAFSLEDFDPSLSGSMVIEAAGYRRKTLNMS
jgi:hypothetical protein